MHHVFGSFSPKNICFNPGHSIFLFENAGNVRAEKNLKPGQNDHGQKLLDEYLSVQLPFELLAEIPFQLHLELTSSKCE